MDKVRKLIDELYELCKEEKVNLTLAAAKTGDDEMVKLVNHGELNELVLLNWHIKEGISGSVGSPYEVIEFAVRKQLLKEQKEND